MKMEDVVGLTKLGEYGMVGVMLALIALCGFAIYFLWKFACNHVEHNNDVMARNTEAITKLTSLIEYKLK